MLIHALLHLAQDIRNMGPLWVYWCFVMERFCGSLLPSVKSRKHPNTSLANRIRNLAQNSQIELIYQLHNMMDLSDTRYDMQTGECFRTVTLPSAYRTKVLAHITTNYIISVQDVRELVPMEITQWGKRRHAFGDVIHGAEMVSAYSNEHSDCRDTSWIEFTEDCDRNARNRRTVTNFEEQMLYGQVLRFVGVRIPLTLKFRYPPPENSDSGEDDGFAVEHTELELKPDSDNCDFRTVILAIIRPAVLTVVDDGCTPSFLVSVHAYGNNGHRRPQHHANRRPCC
ncbi:hypothetical protein BDV98DRAFT_576835 [Pterulicium gracile]|uniref:DUF4218 domain-containing protein n=1 Tax=Pterulicium gracile TaxID=1884261 RepID=A0A5C3Q1Q9_9AGAR|nr:hypothetical protein BDV98DRAFT_576835 [Pterula gracilis]